MVHSAENPTRVKKHKSLTQMQGWDTPIIFTWHSVQASHPLEPSAVGSSRNRVQV